MITAVFSRQASPPRPVAAGDIVVGYSAELGAWSAAQVTDLDPQGGTFGVLELDWSGPEPTSVAELGEVSPLVVRGKPVHRNYAWVLPRGCRVLGNRPPLAERSLSYSADWRVGSALASRRRAENGVESDPTALTRTGEELRRLLDDPDWSGEGLRSLRVESIGSLDVADVVRRCPGLTRLFLGGELGTLANARAVNELTGLRSLYLANVFGMVAADYPVPERLSDLTFLYLHEIPADYARAVRAAWKAEVANGTLLDISAPRDPAWVVENRDNPLRDWDGRGQIGKRDYRRAIAQYRSTRRAVFEAIAHGAPADRLFALGEEFGTAFNRLDADGEFIETEEREELFDALATIARDAAAEHTAAPDDTLTHLAEGVDSVRDW